MTLVYVQTSKDAHDTLQWGKKENTEPHIWNDPTLFECLHACPSMFTHRNKHTLKTAAVRSELKGKLGTTRCLFYTLQFRRLNSVLCFVSINT